MPANTPTRSYLAITLTLTAATATNLQNAINTALAAAEGGNAPTSGSEITIQNDPSSPAALLIGDAKIATSPQRCGTVLGSGQAKTYRSNGAVQRCPLGSLFLRSTGAAIVNVEVWV